MVVICDTSALLAFANDKDPYHQAVAAAFDMLSPTLGVVSPLVLAEYDYLARKELGLQAAKAALRAIFASGFEVPKLTSGDLLAACDVNEAYADLNIGLTDATLVVLAQRYRTCDILTLDRRHFRAITPIQGGNFRVLPEDSD